MGALDEDDLEPLQFLPVSPFAEEDLMISGSPIRIVDQKTLSVITDTSELSVPIAIATTLWSWCPDALRKFLDIEEYPIFEWSCHNDRHGVYTRIRRHGHDVHVGNCTKERKPISGCGFFMPKGGLPWIPTSNIVRERAAEFPEQFSGDMAFNLLYWPRWTADRNHTHSLLRVDRQQHRWVYPDDFIPELAISDTAHSERCQRCFKPPKLGRVQQCLTCDSAWYCSRRCRLDDLAVHKGACQKIIKSRPNKILRTKSRGSRQQTKLPKFSIQKPRTKSQLLSTYPIKQER